MLVFNSFSELLREKHEDEHFRRDLLDRDSSIVLVAPHGGGIEPGTSEIARAIAGEDLSLYVFEGIQPRQNEDLHVDSTRFDDPSCLEIIARCVLAVTIHGCEDEGYQVFVGGRNRPFIDRTIKVLDSGGYETTLDETDHSGTSPENICNRCSSHQGIQLELTESLRASFFRSLTRRGRSHPTAELNRFSSLIREVLSPTK